MKKILVVFLCLPLFAGAQKLIGGKNILKWNLAGLAARNYSFTYERSFLNRFSLSLNYRTMAKGSLPFQSWFESAIDSDDILFNEFQIGNTAWTPEARVYIGLGKMKGFYVSPYYRFASFDLYMPVSYTNGVGSKNKAVFEGTVKSSSPGLMIGWQFQLLTKLVLDFQIVGGHWGKSSGEIVYKSPTPLSTLEQDGLRKALNNIDAGPFTFNSTVNSSGAVIYPTGWAGIRGLNLGVGLRF
jgi:hypothetical protein